MSRAKRVSVELGRVSEVSATARVKTHFNVQHMIAAAYFAKKALEIESENDATLIEGELYHAHRGYVTGSVFSAVASLETNINELYIDAQEGNTSTFQGLDPVLPMLLAECWEEIERAATLRKYQSALILARKPKFDRGTSPYQYVDDLIVLRNALVHYKPEWDTDQKDHRKLERRLKFRFAPNPLVGSNSAFCPKRCLGHGCAEWAVRSGVSFMEEFTGRLGLPSIFRNYPKDLLRTR